MRTVYLCAAVRIPDDVDEDDLVGALRTQGVEIIPCNFEPDPDTVLYSMHGDERDAFRRVMDLSPMVPRVRRAAGR